MTMPGRREPTERELTRMVRDYWSQFGFPETLLWANPNAGALGQIGLTRGVPDLSAIGGAKLLGRTLYIEMKTRAGVVKPAQQMFHDKLRSAGAPVYVCRSFEEAHDALVEWGVCKPIKQARADAA